MDEKQFEKEIPVKRLRRELAYEGTILKVYKDYVDANGVHAVWDYIHHDGAAAVLPVTDEGKILMVRQYRNALDRFTLEIPAGKVDSADEPRRICAFRELEEETGFRVDKPEDLEFLIRIDTTVAFLDEEIDIFVARNLKKSAQHLDEDEVIKRLLERGKTSGRADDNFDTIKKRLRIYQEVTKPVSAYYLRHHNYFLINGNYSVEQTFEQIDTILRLRAAAAAKKNND
jgi:ADP-ribose pyrophosphatase